jgi:hypothetical protein
MRSFAASGVRFAFCFVMVSGMAALTACGGGDGSGSTASATSPPTVANPSTAPAPNNQAPTISGTPATTATTGKAYTFTPTAADADASDKVTFTIANKPAWAAFDAATGALTGTPAAADVGASQPIEIAATDGTAVTTLPQFTITVSAASSTGKSVSLAWTPPTENSDGSSLVDLKGYKIHYGSESQNYTSSVSVDNPGLTRYVIESLPAGTLYIAMTAFNAAGAESPFSKEVTVTLN